jgi:Na+-translocating ferredoxin:NAD+ oxidoreductase RnfC subunit
VSGRYSNKTAHLIQVFTGVQVGKKETRSRNCERVSFCAKVCPIVLKCIRLYPFFA